MVDKVAARLPAWKGKFLNRGSSQQADGAQSSSIFYPNILLNSVSVAKMGNQTDR